MAEKSRAKKTSAVLDVRPRSSGRLISSIEELRSRVAMLKMDMSTFAVDTDRIGAGLNEIKRLLTDCASILTPTQPELFEKGK